MTGVAASRLRDVARFVRGITFTPDDVVPVGTPGSVACIRTKNVQAYLDLSDVWAVPSSFVKRDDQYLEPGDVIVSSANSWNLVGKCCSVPKLPWPASLGGFVSALRGDGTRVSARYLFHWFSSPRVQATVRSFGQQTTNISNLNVERCLDLPIPIPPFSEQQRIAQILDKADALRAKRRAALAQLDALTRAIFLDMFGDPATNPRGWPLRKIGEFIQSASYGTSEKAGTIGDFPVLRMNNITPTGGIDLTGLKYMNLREDERQRYLVQMGDVLFNRTNSQDLVGKTAIYRHSRPVAYAGYLIRLRVKSGNDPEYLAAFLNTGYSKRVLRGMCRSIIGMANINATELQKVRIPEPPSSLQNEFASRVAIVERQRASLRAESAQLDALFASLQHRAFRGEL